MNEVYGELIKDITEIYREIDNKLAKESQTIIKPTPEAIASLTATVLINHEKNQRVKDMKAEREPKAIMTKVEILKELNTLKSGETSYPIEVEEKENLIIINKTVNSMAGELWGDVNNKVKSLGGRWYKERTRWEIRV